MYPIHRCTSCHNPSGIAPFSLVDYANASGAAAGIYDAVINNRMPPWPPDPTYRSYAHEKNLARRRNN
ncbi:MAG: cytochrome c [Bacteroidetes bacterium]|nr:cytochrome c [Bacteroidota bacterium]